MITLAEFLEYWPSVRSRTRRLLPLIPPDYLEWIPAEGRWSLGDTARHLAGIERWMYAENMHRRPTRYPGHGRELADGLDAVIAYHDRCHTGAMDQFRSLTEQEWLDKSLTPAGTMITTWKWARAMVEHEAHHRGQVYFMLGVLQVPTPPIFGLSEPEVLAKSRPGDPA